jgi:hypothetical protein
LETSVHNNTASMMMNNQNMMVFKVELGFTALPHLPDGPARATSCNRQRVIDTNLPIDDRFAHRNRQCQLDAR